MPQSIIWVGTKAYTPVAQGEEILMTHISAHLGYGSNAECGKSTAPAITLPAHSVQCMMLNSDVCKGEGIGQMWTHMDRGRG